MKHQLTSLLVERYLSVLTLSSDSEKEEVRQILFKDESLMSTVDMIMDIATNSQGGTWASFMGFREVSRYLFPARFHFKLGVTLSRFS